VEALAMAVLCAADIPSLSYSTVAMARSIAMKATTAPSPGLIYLALAVTTVPTADALDARLNGSCSNDTMTWRVVINTQYGEGMNKKSNLARLLYQKTK
jgi:hypothetical protein